MWDLVGNPEYRFSHNEAHLFPIGSAGYFWHITDFHWDFSYHGKGLSCTASNSSGRGDLGSYLCDSPWKLLDETLAEARKIKPDPEFIIWTG